MTINRGVAAAVAGSAALLVGGGAVALAENGGQASRDRQSRCEARLARIAEHRGVSVADLETQIRARLSTRVDEALADGKITADRAAELKGRIASFEFCSGHGRHQLARLHGVRRMLKAAADFLGLDRAGLRAQLPGTSLAALAQKQGKSQADLEAAMLSPAKARLAKAVASGHLKQARADRILARLTTLADTLATKTFPVR
jgi:hypothetical protein